MADLAERIYTEREQARIMPDESITMQSLLTVGTSAGGRQPKAIIAINRKTGEIRSGQISGLKNYDYCLLKFGNTQYSSAELEMAYYELATMAGIRMMLYIPLTVTTILSPSVSTAMVRGRFIRRLWLPLVLMLTAMSS